MPIYEQLSISQAEASTQWPEVETEEGQADDCEEDGKRESQHPEECVQLRMRIEFLEGRTHPPWHLSPIFPFTTAQRSRAIGAAGRLARADRDRAAAAALEERVARLQARPPKPCRLRSANPLRDAGKRTGRRREAGRRSPPRTAATGDALRRRAGGLKPRARGGAPRRRVEPGGMAGGGV